MISWVFEQLAGFWWTCVAIVLFCMAFDIPIHINLTV